jgi:hypothetical protein
LEYPSYQPVFLLQTRPEIDPAFEEWQRRQSATSARIYSDNFSSFGPHHKGMFNQMQTTKTHEIIHFLLGSQYSILCEEQSQNTSRSSTRISKHLYICTYQ